MTTALQPTGTDPAIGAAIDVYNRLSVIRNVLAPDLNDQELQLFAIVADRSRLDPFAKQIYAIKRGGRVTFQTGIDGFRSSAEETGDYRGSDEPAFGPIIEKPFAHPEWARVVVHRQFDNGEWLHQPATVYWDEFYPGGQNVGQWNKMPRNQLAKCAEAAAFRKAFPKRFSDVYTAEEMDQADAAERARPVAPTAADRIAQRRAEHEIQAGGSEAIGSTDPSAGMPIPADAQTGTCSIASPKGDPCLVTTRHTVHKNGNKSWPTPQQAQPAEVGAEGQEHEESAGEQPTPADNLVAAAREAFEGDIAEGDFTPVQAGENDPSLQAGMDLLKQ